MAGSISVLLRWGDNDIDSEVVRDDDETLKTMSPYQ
jgi:hypothetical protein